MARFQWSLAERPARQNLDYSAVGTESMPEIGKFAWTMFTYAKLVRVLGQNGGR